MWSPSGPKQTLERFVFGKNLSRPQSGPNQQVFFQTASQHHIFFTMCEDVFYFMYFCSAFSVLLAEFCWYIAEIIRSQFNCADVPWCIAIFQSGILNRTEQILLLVLLFLFQFHLTSRLDYSRVAYSDAFWFPWISLCEINQTRGKKDQIYKLVRWFGSENTLWV